MNLAKIDLLNRLSILVSIFLISYVFGANNIGFIHGLMNPFVSDSVSSQFVYSLIILVSTIMGIVILGYYLTEIIGEKFVVLSPQGLLSSMIASTFCIWAFTQIAIPVSITHILIGSVIGATLTKKIVLFNKKILYLIIIGAIGSTLFSLSLSYAIIKVVFN